METFLTENAAHLVLASNQHLNRFGVLLLPAADGTAGIAKDCIAALVRKASPIKNGLRYAASPPVYTSNESPVSSFISRMAAHSASPRVD